MEEITMATFTNQATLSYNDTITNSNIVTGELLEVLTLTKTAVVPQYDGNGTVTYVISINNSGTAAFTGLTLTDDLGGYPFGDPEVTLYPLDYVTGSLRYFINGTLQAAPAVTEEPLIIGGITVPAGGNTTLIYEARITDAAPADIEGAITNTATLSGGGLSTALTDSETITTEIAPDLTISKAICPAVITENGQVTYTLTLQNSGNAPADAEDNIIVSDTFDPVLSGITVRLNGVILTEGTDYTYDETTGAFATVAGRVTVPAATFSQNADGIFVTEPGVAVLTIVGTV